MTKSVLFSLLAMSSVLTAAHAEEKSGEKFEEHKKEMISNLDSRIASLNEAKACAQSASSGEGLKACHDKLKAAHEAMAEKAIDSRIERLQKRKAEMKAKKGH